ncbi:MAG: 16S rRNA (cytosine(1402)-N(4))-methyltransferase RsmH [bacterium]|nr:16S rRNA (cytosine(1402)-N(4))-methyltransferase RsmH [bacterium]
MHRSVLLKESIESLNLKSSQVFVDGTFGGGGHSREALRLFPGIRVVSIDQDPATGADITGNFRDLDKLLGEVRPDAILLDLGISSDQLETSGKGFSFQKDEPLDMRMSGPLDKLEASSLTAADILNSWDEHAIELILRGFGEEKYSGRIAREIVTRREVKPFSRTSDLVEMVTAVKPKSFRDKINPATKTFQALRIAVNEELTALEEGLQKGFEALAPSGRLAVISFHSLEDRIVKNFFRDRVKEGRAKLINKKPIVPSAEEVGENPRSRSAKLRVIEKL